MAKTGNQPLPGPGRGGEVSVFTPLPGQPATGERAVAELRRHFVTLARREDNSFGAASQNRVRGLLGDEALQPVVFRTKGFNGLDRGDELEARWTSPAAGPYKPFA